MSNILITICARGGSVGVPDKNIKLVNGKPLISYTIKHAFEFQSKFSGVDILLSTDSEKIKGVAAKFGLSTEYQRPAHLGASDIGKVAVIKDALRYAENTNNKCYDMVLDLDVTSPLRTLTDLTKALEQSKTNNKLITFSVNHSHKNPYFNIVEFDGENYSISKSSDGFLSRQKAPQTYDINGSFYFYKRAFFDMGIDKVTEKGVFDVFVMDHICHDVDSQEDLMYLEWVIERNIFSV